MTLQEIIEYLKQQADERLRLKENVLRIHDAAERIAAFHKLPAIVSYGRVTCEAISKRPNSKGPNYLWFYDNINIPGTVAVERRIMDEMRRLGDLT